MTNKKPNKEEMLSAWLALTEGCEPSQEPVRLPVLSGSMLPDIPPGSTLVIVPCASKDLQRGDVVVFQTDNRLTAHRLIIQCTIGPLQVLFQKGDSNTHGSWISPRQVKGKVLEVEREHDIIPVSSNMAASESLRHLFRSWGRNLFSWRR